MTKYAHTRSHTSFSSRLWHTRRRLSRKRSLGRRAQGSTLGVLTAPAGAAPVPPAIPVRAPVPAGTGADCPAAAAAALSLPPHGARNVLGQLVLGSLAGLILNGLAAMGANRKSTYMKEVDRVCAGGMASLILDGLAEERGGGGYREMQRTTSERSACACARTRRARSTALRLVQGSCIAVQEVNSPGLLLNPPKPKHEETPDY
eukprot:180367-Pelagomonas_calceolata.AAC.3